MYKVPLIINQRDVIIALHPSDLPTKNVAIDTFVVDNTELLRFYKKILALDYDGPLSNDYILNISAISRKEDAITVEFTTFKQGGIAYSQDGLELTNDHYCYLRLKQFPNEATRFHIHLWQINIIFMMLYSTSVLKPPKFYATHAIRNSA